MRVIIPLLMRMRFGACKPAISFSGWYVSDKYIPVKTSKINPQTNGSNPVNGLFNVQ
jgi:hypothetical protein